ncbi:glycosyl transferase, group 1 [Christiangramia flava JLT2011]|uniref:Glycosyltransferase LafA, responsible for the formation of Glc-DAG n=2 Tax=Christiangramia TaxID=292691 RepID=A0A1L7I142_9FLAO|nr:glycosyltransferase family 4 protein [Christiangramia flava]APU66802.1 Glycosyltransferase LafA, responsible for the formation of Glc-DAG [Christiangramia flava JLT2011]OSS38439.1 glycosyl transferase, group 1 [Christiangramia flava JLT2011]
MKILYYSTAYYSQHGGRVQSREFFSHLKEIPNYEVRIFPETEVKSTKNQKSNWKNLIKRNGLFQVLSFFRRNNLYLNDLLETLNSYKPEVLIMQMDSNFLQIRKVKKLFPQITICTQINGSHFDESFSKIIFKRTFKKWERKAYGCADLNIFVTEESRKMIMGDHVSVNRDIVIANGVDLSKFHPLDKTNLRQKLQYPENDFILGYIGTIDNHKNLSELLLAIENISMEDKSIKLVIIGSGPGFLDLQNQVEFLELTDQVLLKGFIPFEEINEHLNCFDLAVHHSANSYMHPLKLMEYLAVGIPVIAPDIPFVRQEFKNGEDVLINTEKQKLENLIISIKNDDNLREKLSNNSNVKQKLQEKFSWNAYAEKIAKHIEEKRK